MSNYHFCHTSYKLKFAVIIFIILGLNTFFVLGQSVANYQFESRTDGSLQLDKDGNTIDMSTGTAQFYGPNINTYSPSFLTLPFPFYLVSQLYANYSLNPDGQVRLSNGSPTLISGSSQSPVANTGFLIPVNTDGKTSPTGKVHSKVFGTTPNRVYVIEWKDIVIPASGTANTNYSTFQMRLYEQNSVIEYVYGSMYNTSSSNAGFAIGFSSSVGLGNIANITNVETTPAYVTSLNSFTAGGNVFTANAPMMNLNSSADGNRTLFRFTPPEVVAPSNINFSNILPGTFTLNWTDNSNNENGFRIYRSMDGVNYTLVHILGPNETSSNEVFITPSTLHYFKVEAYAEGGGKSVTASVVSGSCSRNGTYTIPGDYTSITAAAADLKAFGVNGPVILELQSNYNSSVETFPLVLGEIPCASIVNTITIRPAANAANLSIINSSFDSPLIGVDLYQGDYWIFDGRAGGVGNTINLTISGRESAVRLINTATHNTFQYVNFTSSRFSSTAGVITFWNFGNSYNTIDHCSIDGGAGNEQYPQNSAYFGIYSSATGTPANKFNVISNNNIYNFYRWNNAQLYHCGIYLFSTNSDWTIENNSFYQTAPRAAQTGTALLIPIYIASGGENFVIRNNYIGGSAPMCGGAPLTWTGEVKFIGINFTGANNLQSNSFQGNVIQNISMSTNSAQAGNTFDGMVIGAGISNVGNETGNIIGSATGTGSISITSITGTTNRGITVSSNNSSSIIANNVVGSISMNGSLSTSLVNFTGIELSNVPNSSVIRNNLIGSLTTPSSIQANMSNSGTLGSFIGVKSLNYPNTVVEQNTIANISWNYSSTPLAGGTLTGIIMTGPSNIRNNVIRDLYTNSGKTSTGNSASVVGIFLSSFNTGPFASPEISGNSIYSLKNYNSNAAASVLGIGYNGFDQSAGFDNLLVFNNSIHGLTVANPGGNIYGIYSSASIASYYNNMIRLGIDLTGDITVPCNIYGIYDASGNKTYYHNTVYIGGKNVGNSTSNTFAFYSFDSDSSRNVRNNILINNRSNAGAGGKHYCVSAFGSNPNPAGLTLDYNLYFASGNGGYLGLYNNNNISALNNWQTAVGQDAHSLFTEPCLVDPEGSVPDLHLDECVSGNNPADGSGIMIPSMLTDIDGESRSSLTPTDIGADAISFICTPPVFSQCPFDTLVFATEGHCTASISYSSMTSGTTPISYTYVFSGVTTASGSGTGSGSVFNAGHTNVSITATNSCGAVTCEFIIILVANINDNNECTIDQCNSTTGIISHTPVPTDDNNACTDDGCNTSTGVFHDPVATDDHNACTNDGCNTISGVYHDPVSIDDNDACTTDGCDSNSGVYHHVINPDDGNACTTDYCDSMAGVLHDVIEYDDYNACTLDGCDSVTGIYHIPVETDDHNVCTIDGCDSVSGIYHNEVDIDDHDVCTIDACNSINGISHTPVDIDDHDVCTTDACHSVTGISHTPVDIDDHDVCTTDACHSVTGVSHMPVDIDDHDLCTTDACHSVTGISHTPVDIDDHDVCTIDACNSITGISHTPV